MSEVALNAGRMMIVAETEGKIYPGTVYGDLGWDDYHAKLKEEMAAGSTILRARPPDNKRVRNGVVHVSLVSWDECRAKILEAGATIISEHPEDGFFLTIEEATVSSSPMELVGELILDKVKILPAGVSESMVLTIPNPGPGPVLIRRIAVEGVRLPEER